MESSRWCGFFLFNDTATTEIYTLSLHDALPISGSASAAPMANGQTTYQAWNQVVASSRPPSRRSEEHTSELQSRRDLVCRLLLEKKKKKKCYYPPENKKKKN